MMEASDYPAHNFDFNRWLMWGEDERRSEEYPEGYPTEQDCLPDPENEFEEE